MSVKLPKNKAVDGCPPPPPLPEGHVPLPWKHYSFGVLESYQATYSSILTFQEYVQLYTVTEIGTDAALLEICLYFKIGDVMAPF